MRRVGMGSAGPCWVVDTRLGGPPSSFPHPRRPQDTTQHQRQRKRGFTRGMPGAWGLTRPRQARARGDPGGWAPPPPSDSRPTFQVPSMPGCTCVAGGMKMGCEHCAQGMYRRTQQLFAAPQRAAGAGPARQTGSRAPTCLGACPPPPLTVDAATHPAPSPIEPAPAYKVNTAAHNALKLVLPTTHATKHELLTGAPSRCRRAQAHPAPAIAGLSM